MYVREVEKRGREGEGVKYESVSEDDGSKVMYFSFLLVFPSFLFYFVLSLQLLCHLICAPIKY